MKLKVTKPVHFRQGRRQRKVLEHGTAPATQTVEKGNVSRIARLMALAHRLENLVRQGEVTDYAELARLGYVSRARITQIMNFLWLAPDIQEEILFLARPVKGRDPIRERQIRPIAAILDWRKQRRMWKQLLADQQIQQ
ncbi:MAG: hypothetical protein JXA42_16455 [Anaerolineales bacterium]|nr:hypothetical protein [Anaerolineales bacterium]